MNGTLFGRNLWDLPANPADPYKNPTGSKLPLTNRPLKGSPEKKYPPLSL